MYSGTEYIPKRSDSGGISNRPLSESYKDKLTTIHSQLGVCNKEYDKLLETSKCNGEALKEIKHEINDMRQQQQQTLFEREHQMKILQNDMLEFQNKMNQTFFERQRQLRNLQTNINDLRNKIT